MPPPRARWIQILLLQGEGQQRYNKPVVGRTRLIKELFLLKKGYGLKQIEYEFIPYWYGPFSPEIYADLAELKDDRILESRDSVGGEVLSLTPAGVASAQVLERSVDADLIMKIRDCKERFNSKPFDELVAYVYERWPEYTSRSLQSPFSVLKELKSQAGKARITDADVDAAVASYRARTSTQ